MGFLRGGTNASNPPNYVGLNIQTSSEGMVLPVVYGANLVAPNLVWADNFQKKSGSGKKGGGGKGGGGKGGSSATYYSGVILAACEGPIAYGRIFVDQSTVTDAGTLNLQEYTGTSTQTPFDCISSLPGFVPIAYHDVAYLASNMYNLGSSATLPSHSFEIIGFFNNTSPAQTPFDVNPATILYDICTNTRYGLAIPPDLIGDLSLYADYCGAYGLLMSPSLDKEEQAISIFQRWAQLTNSWMFWSENQLKVVPLGDTALTQYGVTFTPVNTVRYALGFDEFISDKDTPPITVERVEPSKAYNWTKIDALDRDNAYSTATVEYKDQTSIMKYGVFQANTVQADEVCDRGIASLMVGLIGTRALYIRNTFKFTLSYNFVLLEPGDIVTVTDTAIGLDAYPVRVRSIGEDDKGNLAIEAEECPSGVGSGIAMVAQATGATPLPAYDVDPGDVNVPAIIEPALVVTAGTPQVWIGGSGASVYWGGANVFISVDDVTYINAGTLPGKTPQGVLLAILPSHADPDTVDTLSVNCIESLVALTSTVTDADADAARTLAIVGTEQLAYGSVVPNGTNAYSFDLTYLRRGLYSTTIASHAIGAPFSAIVPDNMLQIDLPLSYVGQTIYVKLTSFNIFGLAEQDISTVTRYTYTPAGVGYTINAPSSPVLAITTPTDATSIAMTLSWVASTGPNLASYEVQFSDDSGSTWVAADVSVGGSATMFTLQPAIGLTNYQARVRAISAGSLAISAWATSSVVNSGVAPPSGGGGSLLPLVNGDMPVGIVTNSDGVPVYVLQ